MVNKENYKPFDAFPGTRMQLEFSRTSDSAFALVKVGVRALKFRKLLTMTPNPPAPPDGSGLPPRHRPSMGNLAKDTTEQDLWAFDDTDPLAEEITESLPKSIEQKIPIPRETEKIKVRQLTDPAPSKSSSYPDSIRVNVGKNAPKIQVPTTSGQSKPGSEFDDLDHWDDLDAVAPILQTPVEIEIPAVAPTPQPVADSKDEFSPPVREQAAPVSVRSRMNLTKLERLGLVALCVLLLGGAAMAFLYTISRLPTDSGRVKANDFPIRGSHITIHSAVSFWRAPKAADTARRGTQLVPVVDLTSSGGPAAIRVFFRNSDGDVIGDAVTRFLQAGGKLQVAATAGFDDVGMHAAYRTGGNKAWTIEVLEAATENAPGPEFKRLFEMNISTDRR